MRICQFVSTLSQSNPSKQVVIHTLRKTIYIDFDKIEGSTASRCSSQPTPSGFSESEEPHGFPSSALPARGYRDDGDVNDPMEGPHHGENSRAENEADRMLEQAEALEFDFDFQDYLHLDDGSE